MTLLKLDLLTLDSNMMRSKNISVVGCGYWGKNLIRNFAELGCLNSVSDVDIDLAKLRSDEFKVPYITFEEVISNDDIQGIVIAAPAFLHAELAIIAMNAGKHVFVEKPMAINLKEANQMIKTSQDNKVSLMIGHLLQYHPIFRKLKHMVDINEFGKVKHIYSNRLSFGKIRSEEDVVLSFAPHDISMVLSLAANAKPVSVKRDSLSILQKGIDDIAHLNIEFSNSLQAHINVSWLSPLKEQKLVLIGERCTAIFDDTQTWKQKLAIYNNKINFEDMSVLKSKPRYVVDIPEAEPLKEECSYFYDVVNGKSSPITDGQEGYSVLSVLEAAEKAKSGKKISI